MPPTEPLAGTIDLVGRLAERTEMATNALRVAFRQYGYEPVAPPIIERAGPFLDRSGEDIRDRMYIFSDPAGREVCLRPELTIPTARLYADKFKGENQILRAFYIGPVFRYEKPREGRYRQFTQVGAEFIGETNECLADAETLALADHALRSCGLEDLHIAVSDIQFFTSVFDDASLSARWKQRLRNLASDPRALRQLLERAAGPERPGATSTLELERALASVPEGDRNDVLQALLKSLALDGGFGSRDVDDIVERVLEKAETSGKDTLPQVLIDGLNTLLDINAPLADGLKTVTELAHTMDAPSLIGAVELWTRRIELLAALGINTDAIRLDLSLRRGFAYYSGFVFEIHAGEPASQVCAGGRYNELVATLGGRTGTPAVGFALGLERALLAMEDSEQPVAGSRLDVFVVGAGDVPDASVVRTTRALRSTGLSAVFLNGRRLRYALGIADKRGVRYVAVVGERELGEDLIGLRDLEARRQINVTIDEAARIVRDREPLP
jgi:histidyl-tRNA synthetase